MKILLRRGSLHFRSAALFTNDAASIYLVLLGNACILWDALCNFQCTYHVYDNPAVSFVALIHFVKIITSIIFTRFGYECTKRFRECASLCTGVLHSLTRGYLGYVPLANKRFIRSRAVARKKAGGNQHVVIF